MTIEERLHWIFLVMRMMLPTGQTDRNSSSLGSSPINAKVAPLAVTFPVLPNTPPPTAPPRSSFRKSPWLAKAVAQSKA
jgi:hypothetical protein